MVHVQPPKDFAATSPAELPTDPPASDHEVSLATATFDDAVGMLDDAPSRSVSSQAADAQPVEKDDPPVLPGSQWSSFATRKRLMIAAGGLAGLVLAIGVFAIVVANSNEESPRKDVASVDDAPSVPPKDNTETDPPKLDDPRQDTDTTKDGTIDPEPDNPKDNPETVSPPVVKPMPEDPPPAPKDGSKVDVSPPGLNPDGGDKPDESPRSLLKDLEAFGELLDGIGFESSEKGVDESLDLDDISEGPPLRKPEPRAIDVVARLDDKFLGIEFKDVPLSVYLQDLSDLSTVPITLDPEALAWANLSPNALVAVHLTDTRIGEMLEEVITPHKLAVIAKFGHVLVTWPQAEPREVEYDVDDLIVRDAKQLTRLMKMTQDLVAPKSWEELGGTGTIRANTTSLTVTQSEAIHYQILVFLEKLRVARGLPIRSSYDAARFQLATREVKAQPKLNMLITVNYVRPARLVEILKRIQSKTKVNVLVDWQATSKIGWTPDTELPFSADDQPLGEALRLLLRRMKLAYRIVDETTVQITTPKAMMEKTDFEIYTADDLLSENLKGNQLVEGLKTALGAVHFFDGAGGMVFDEPSRSLLVTLPQPQQIALAKLLENLRASK